jgi:hypothetical protein
MRGRAASESEPVRLRASTHVPESEHFESPFRHAVVEVVPNPRQACAAHSSHATAAGRRANPGLNTQ